MNLNSQQNYNTLYLVLLFISLSSIVPKNLNTLKLNYENKPVNFRINNSKNQQLIDIKFTSNSRSKYMKIFINENISESNNYIISVFSDEKRTKNIQMDKIIFGNQKLWLTESEIKNKKIYLNVECNILPCNFILNISPEEKIKLNISEQISYYVNEQNLEMIFIFDLNSIGKNEQMNIWAKGEFEIITKLGIENNVFEYEKNNLYSIKPGNYNGNELILKVTAKKGDFINVGSQIFEKNLAKNSSLIKDNPVINFLSENELKKSYYDYDLTEIDENYQNYNNKKNMTYTSEITLSNIDDKFKSQSILTENTDSENEHFLTFEINSNYTNNVTLLKKSNMETFFIIENTPRFYYLNVNSGEVLSIIINFNRGSEKIYCKLVNSSIDPFDVSQYPQSSEDYINYDSYLKKIEYFIDDDECEDGCYILITAATDTKNYKELVRNFTFSISTYYDSLFETVDISPVNISPDEYIIGDIAYNEDYLSNQLYYIQIQNNTDEIIIDLQSNEAYICVKIGNQKFQPVNADFKFFPYDKNSVFSINKTEIINKAKEKKYDIINNDNSLKDFGLTIGLLTKNYDSVYTTVYAFLIHLKKDETKYDIYKVNFDQTTLCNTTKISNKETYPYRCLYIIYPETYSNFTDLLVYANSQNESIEYQIYADYLEIEEYNDDIEKKIPNINSKFSTNKTKLNYIYLNEGLNNKYLFVSVVSKTNTTIQLMTSFYSIEKEMSVNPNTPQLFIMNNEKLELEFNNYYNNFAINLMSFSGEAEIFWSNENNNKYYLRGREDRLSFFCKMDNNKLIINNLKTKNNTKDNEIPGLAFYLNYELKSVKNFDETQFGKSVTFEYVNSQLPLDIYTKLPNYDKNISIFFSFYNIEPEDYNKYMNNKINIKASIITQATVLNVKSDPTTSVFGNNLVQGVYDPGLRVGFLRLTKENFDSFKISESDKPNLYVTIIDDNTNENVKYTKISLKMTVIQENSLVQTSENVYQYGSLSTNKACVYKLKPYLQKPNMRIEFSSTDENIKYNISKSSENKNDGTIIVNREKNYNGRKLIDINADPENNDYLYLHIYREENDTKQEENLEGNFVFKYINYVEISNLKDYYISNSEIIASEENKTITLKFNAIPNSTFFNVTYIVKLIYSKDNTIKETIAFSSIYNVIKVKEYKNPNVDEGNINLEIQNKEDANYVVIYAIINDKSINEYVSYKVSKIKKTENKTDDSSSTSTIIMVIVILLITVTVILVISLFIFSKKNKDLMYKVNKLSFKTDERTSGLEGDTLYKNI